MTSSAQPVGSKNPKPASALTGRKHTLWQIGGVAAGAVAAVGWCTAAYLYFVAMPDAIDAHKVAYTLELVERFGDSPAHQVYMKLSDDMKPWWDSIEETQRQIAATTDESAREKLIAKRDETLIVYIRTHYLANQIDLLINSFSRFNRCLALNACDQDTLKKAISIDVKRIYRTFRPYIESVRGSGRAGTDDFGRDLEDLYFRFVS
jgi:hypothetical protein